MGTLCGMTCNTTYSVKKHPDLFDSAEKSNFSGSDVNVSWKVFD